MDRVDPELWVLVHGGARSAGESPLTPTRILEWLAADRYNWIYLSSNPSTPVDILEEIVAELVSGRVPEAESMSLRLAENPSVPAGQLHAVQDYWEGRDPWTVNVLRSVLRRRFPSEAGRPDA